MARILNAVCLAAVIGFSSGAGAQDALAPPALGPRILTQIGLDLGLNLRLLNNVIGLLENSDVQPPSCKKLTNGGSIETLSVVAASPTQRTSKISAYYDAACAKPYIVATVDVTINNSTETVTFVESASFLQISQKPIGTLQITDVFSQTNSTATYHGLGTFTPVGGQPVAHVGFTCSSTGTLRVPCEGGVAQTFPTLNKSIASVVPFTLTAASNTTAPKVTIFSGSADLRTGPAGSLSITAPTPSSLAISGGGTVYGTATMAGSEAHFGLFTPVPTQWVFNDKGHNERFSFRETSNVSHAARGVVVTVTPAKAQATLSIDNSGTGLVKYTDGRVAQVRSFLAAD